MKSLKYIGTAIVAILALAACDNGTEDTETQHDEAYYASLASVSSADSHFTSADHGGTIRFSTEGGAVVVDVDCGADWFADNEAMDLFPSSYDSANGLLTVTAGQNTVEQDLTGTIILMTAVDRIEFATISIVQTAYGVPELTIGAGEWHAPAAGALSTEIAVESSIGDYDVEVDAEWLSAEKTDSGLTLVADENVESGERSAVVTLTADDGIRAVSETVAVTQDGKVYLALSDNSVTLGAEEGSVSVTVTTNFDWDFSSSGSGEWLTLKRDGSDLIVSTVENSGSKRSEVVTVTAGDGAENVTQTQLTIVQSSANSLILTYVVHSAESRIAVPLSGTIDCTVDWGDGQTEHTTTGPVYHYYDAAGEYNVVIDGTVTALSSYNLISTTESLNIMRYLTAVKQWGTTGLTDLEYAFYYCTKLASVPADKNGSFSEVTTFKYAFSYSGLTEVPQGLFDHCDKAEAFYETFNNCTSLTTLPENLFSGCPSVKEFYYTFSYCTSLKTIPSGMFDGCEAVETFNHTFHRCSDVVYIPAGLFDKCAGVTTFNGVFNECYGLESIPSGLFDSFTKVTTFYGAFWNSGVKSIPAGLFDHCTEVTDFSFVFDYCEDLTSIPTGLFDHCTKATTFECAFSGCGFSTVPSGLFDSCSAVTSFSYVFSNCEALQSVPVAIFDNCKSVTDFSSAFRGCSALTSESPYTVVDGNKVHLFERSASNGFTEPTIYTLCFRSATGLSDYEDIPSEWK